SERSPASTCAIVCFGERPRKTSTFASPRSPSKSTTRRPAALMAAARCTDTLVLPTPPLPPVTAMTGTGRGRAILRISGECMGEPPEASLQQILVGSRARTFGQRHGAHDELMRARRHEVFG